MTSADDDLLRPDRIIETAIAEADGLSDFDGDEWREGLDRFVASLHADAQLNEIGPIVASQQLIGALASRLRVIDQHRQHPEIAETPVAAPIVIAGQPRTGTTILFDLLAQDPRIRAPLTWEVNAPVPPPETATYNTDPRIAQSAEQASLSEAVLPGFQAIHPSGPQRAQECVAIMVGDCKSMQLGTVFRVPTYMKWLLYEADMTSTYRYHRQFLQVLQWKHPGERWLLKTPGHQWHFADLFTAYPDATVLHNHRDPLKVLASVTSLMATLHRLGRDEAPIPELAEEWFEYLADGNDRTVANRIDGIVPADQVIDVAFANFMSDTFGTISDIYDHLGMEFTAEARTAMEQFLAENAATKHGKHTYAFSDTGLDADACRVRTASYEKHFQVPQEAVR